MKFRVTFKDPDSLQDALHEAVALDVANIEDSDEQDAIREIRFDKEYRKCSKWFKWGEYLTVEIDTIENTCIVVKGE